MGSLHDKLILAAKASGYVQKSSRNSQQGYNFAGDEAITNKFREALLEQGVLMHPTPMPTGEVFSVTQIAREGKDMPNILANVVRMFRVSDGSEEILVPAYGQGMDVGDKAVYKALTGSKKYAYRELLMMVTGDDPEEDEKPARKAKAEAKAETKSEPKGETDETDPPATQKQKNLIRAKSNEIGLSKEGLANLRLKVTGKRSSADFTNKDIDAMLAAFEDPTLLAAAQAGGEVVE